MSTPPGLRNRALLVVLWRSGLRCAEALALRSSDIDCDRGTVRVLRGKGRKARTVGIDPAGYCRHCRVGGYACRASGRSAFLHVSRQLVCRCRRGMSGPRSAAWA